MTKPARYNNITAVRIGMDVDRALGEIRDLSPHIRPGALAVQAVTREAALNRAAFLTALGDLSYGVDPGPQGAGPNAVPLTEQSAGVLRTYSGPREIETLSDLISAYRDPAIAREQLALLNPPTSSETDRSQ